MGAAKVVDFATGKPVDLRKPEERVRQEYEKILHYDHCYPKNRMAIEVAVQLGSSKRRCDIAVYDEDGNIVGMVETKSPRIAAKDGKKQLASYMAATPTCRWGVWTNGDELECARRDARTHAISFSPAFSVPPYGQAEVVIANYNALRPASNLKWIFRRINSRLYANTNLPRSEKQGAEMVRFIFCKLTDENISRNTGAPPRFQLMAGERAPATRKRINALWKETIKASAGATVFEQSERITIDDYSLQLIVRELQEYALTKTSRDVVGDAFEVFSERQFAGDKGQFFTPRAVVKMVIDMIAPGADETIIDPACGSGGFLIAAFDRITRGVADAMQKRDIAEHCLFGIDKDNDLAKICRAHMSIIGDGKSNIVTADTLKPFADWSDIAKSKLLVDGAPRQFDVVVTNPPFGSKIKVEQEHVIRQYELSRGKPTAPQVLFVEKCVNLLKEGGRLGIVLPDGLLGNAGDGYLRDWLLRRMEILAVVDCPTATFMPHTGTKTSVLIARKLPAAGAKSGKKAFFAIAEQCGHTYRGAPIAGDDGALREDFSAIAANYAAGRASERMGFYPALRGNILVPRYYDPRIKRAIAALEKAGDADMVSVQEMIDDGRIALTGIAASAASEEYDLHGEVRFIRTSDVARYELAERTQKMVSEETYLRYKDKQDMRRGDILFVKDGDDKIGETAMLHDDADCRILVQTHFKRFRALKMSPYLLLWLLNADIVKKQIRQRVFNQSTLSTIGERVGELRLPVPRDAGRANDIAAEVQRLLLARRDALRALRQQLSVPLLRRHGGLAN